MKFTREQVLSSLKAALESGRPIVSTGTGTGFSAQCMDRVGCDLLVVYTPSYFRMGGHSPMMSLLPCADANAVVEGLAPHILPVVKKAPVFAGVFAADPCRTMPEYLAHLKELGFAGVQNYPTAGQLDGVIREGLEESGLGYSCEVEMIAEAHRQGLVTQAYAFCEEEAKAMAEVGCDIIIAHMGIITKGMKARGQGMDLAQAADKTQRIANAAHAVNPDIFILCHGGPLNQPEDLQYVLDHTTGVAGIFGASAVEYNPAASAITEKAASYLKVTR